MDRKNVLFVAVISLFAFSGGRTLHSNEGATKAGKETGATKTAKSSLSTEGGSGSVTVPQPPLEAPLPVPAIPEAPPPPCDATHPLHQIAADFPAIMGSGDGCGLSILDDQSSLHVILATLVNPLVAGFSSDFDRAIESIERAAQSRSYVLQRHWFPWEPKHLADGKDRPGWLVFRRSNGDAQELLLVLVVGEHPATGLDATEFDAALGEIAKIEPYSDDTRPLLVLGPYFSGTAVSMAQRLAAWCHPSRADREAFCAGRNLIVVSGSATVPRTQTVLEALQDDHVFAASEFHATVLPDELLRAGMRRFLYQQLGDGDDEVADLTEASTEYGVESTEAAPSATTATDTGATSDSVSPSPKRKRSPKAYLCRIAADKGPKIPFPMHIGVLATETGDGKQPDDANDGEELPFVFGQPVADKIRLQLDNTFGALSRYGIRHVGIVASSTDDKIFLVQQFRKSAPNLRVHLYESSIDLADRSKHDELDGIMVASSYPLFPMTQAWARGPRQSLQPFPSMEAEGIYNALLGLLSRSGVSADTAADAGMLDYQPLSSSALPAGPSAWISVSLGNRLWPLATYSPEELTKRGRQKDERTAKLLGFILPATAKTNPCAAVTPAALSGSTPDAAAAPAEDDQLRPVHVGFFAMMGAVVVLLLMLGNIAGFFVVRGAASWWRIPLLSYGSFDDDHGPLTRRRVTLAGLWALGLTGAVMGAIIDLPVAFRGLATMGAGYYAFGVVLIACAFALLGTHVVRALPRLEQAKRHAVIGVQLLFMVGVFVLIFFILWSPGAKRPDGHVFFFFLRAVDTGIGLTPTLPLFIVGMTIYLAALLQLSVLRRAATIHDHAHQWDRDRLPHEALAAEQGTARKSFSECAHAMRAFSQEAARSVLVICVVGTVGGFLLLFLSPLRLGSFEGWLFDGACSAGFALIFTVTVATAWRAFRLWLHLQAFTRSLALHPASAALDRLPDSVAQRFRSPVPGKLAADHIHLALAMNRHALGLTASPHIDTLRRELDARWFPAAQPKAAPAPTAVTPAQDPAVAPDDPLAETCAKLKEDFLALKMAEVLGLMCDATRRMLLIATVSGMAALFGYAIYPFQPAAALTMAGLISVGLVALVALRVLLGIERDHVLSQLAKTTGGAVTPSLGLIARVVGYVIVPLGGLVGSRLQNPGAVIALFQEAAKTLSR